MVFFRSKREFLHAAAVDDRLTLADYLKAAGPEWCAVRENKSLDTGLHKAAAAGHAEALAMILAKAKDADKSARNSNGDTPLHLAAAGGHVQAVKVLLADRAVLEAASNALPVNAAISSGNIAVLDALLATGKADLAADRPPALYHAVSRGSAAAVACLLAVGADPNVPRLAAERLHQRNEFVMFYRRRGEEITPETPLFLAVHRRDPSIVEALLKAGARTERRELPLHCAAYNGDVAIAKLLLDAKRIQQPAGPGIDACNHAGRTALHIAVARNRPEMVRFLLEQGASPAVVDLAGQTPLAAAQQFGLAAIVTLLREAPAAAKAESRPAAQVPLRQPAAAVKPAPASAAPAARDAAQDSESWSREGRSRIVHVEDYPAQNRRLTEIFNFETRERVTISENLSLRSEAVGPRESFDTIAEEALTRAFAEFRRRGGHADESKVFRNRLGKSRPELG
jgi:ankyrin repeat protein